jgi:two-component system response regulator MtrA
VRIAIVEPEPVAADVLAYAAKKRGHQPVVLPILARLFGRLPFTPAVAVISFGPLDGEALASLAQVVEKLPGLGIIVVAERPTGGSAFAALKAGAHDVVTSPYNPFEVILRAERWVESQAGKQQARNGIHLGDLELDLDAHLATKNGVPLQLTRLERRLLYCLCHHHPVVATIERLLSFGWDSRDEPDAALLKTHISHIRRKLREAGGQPLEIVSHQAVGYSVQVPQVKELAS